MKIKEFSIIRYGPLARTERILLDNFNLFFGRNEDGKTLTIDALVKLLLGRNARDKDFERIHRVAENPEGYLVIEDDKGEEIKMPERGHLTQFADLSASECRNIFVIRNSDLSIDSETAFYTTVTDRLTGLRTEEISSIKSKLQGIGKLTAPDSGSSLSDSAKFEKIKSRVGGAGKLIEEITEIQDKIKRRNFDKLEEKYVTDREEKHETEQEIQNLEDARKREKYEKGKEALDKVKGALQGSKGLRVYNDEDQNIWRSCERIIETYTEEKGGLVKDLTQTLKEFNEISQRLREKESEFGVLDERKKKLDDQVKPDINLYNIKAGDLKQQETKSRFFGLVMRISVAIVAASLLGFIARPSFLFYILPILILSLLVSVLSAIFTFQFVRDKAWLTGAFERIKLAASKFELGAEDIGGILSNIQRFDEEHGKHADEVQAIKRRKETLEDRIKELKSKAIPEKEKKAKEAQEKLDGIRRKSGEESLQQYAQKLEGKRDYEKLIGEQTSILKSLFGAKTGAREEDIPFWSEEIEALEKYEDKAKGIKDDEKMASELKEKNDLLQKKLAEISEEMISLKKEMREVERKANEILRSEQGEYLPCETSIDMRTIKDRLEGFITANSDNMENALEAIRIFEEIESEEREKVSELFGKDSSISKFFNVITNGLYHEVVFSQEMQKIEVKRKDGEILGAEKLSGGAYDQLYLSIRLALGEKLLKGKKGFFIMDDPFVKADPDRLERQIEMLTRISDVGWQVIYFSAKGEIKDVLREKIDSGAVNYVEVQSPFS